MITDMHFSIRNAESTRTGKPVANQFFINHGNTDMFQSYDTPIIEVDHYEQRIYINIGYVEVNGNDVPAYKASMTTRKYLKQFCEWTFNDDGERFYKNIDKYIESGKFDDGIHVYQVITKL